MGNINKNSQRLHQCFSHFYLPVTNTFFAGYFNSKATRMHSRYRYWLQVDRIIVRQSQLKFVTHTPYKMLLCHQNWTNSHLEKLAFPSWSSYFKTMMKSYVVQKMLAMPGCSGAGAVDAGVQAHPPKFCFFKYLRKISNKLGNEASKILTIVMKLYFFVIECITKSFLRHRKPPIFLKSTHCF